MCQRNCKCMSKRARKMERAKQMLKIHPDKNKSTLHAALPSWHNLIRASARSKNAYTNRTPNRTGSGVFFYLQLQIPRLSCG